jgi:4-hydroxyphenylacetate 3-monooxygenase
MTPSSANDFANPELAGLIARTQRSPGVEPKERVKLFKLAWDAIGSEFGSRHLQYEMFYSGPTFVARGHSYRCYDWDGAKAMVEDFMRSYALETAAGKPEKSAAE